MKQTFYTFKAESLEAAYRAMRDKLGDDAIVVRTTNITEGGILGGLFGHKLVQVTASATSDEPSAALRTLSAVEQRYTESMTPAPDVHSPGYTPTPTPVVAQAASPDSDRVDYFKKIIRDAQHRMGVDEESSSKPQLDLYTTGSPTLPMNPHEGQTPVTSTSSPAYPRRGNTLPAEPIPFESNAEFNAPPKEPLSDDDVRHDIAEMRSLLQVMSAEMPGAELPKECIPHYRTLLENGVTRKRAASLIHTAAKRGDLRALRDERVFFERLKMEMRKYIKVTGGTVLHADRRRVVAMIGPTGVGKTTNLAKLAALFSVQEQAKVAVITADTYRVSATDQLNTYATIIDLDMRIVHDAKEMKAALHAFKHHDLVLIDTAGSSPYNTEQMAELQTLLDAASPDEIQLVLSASTSLDDLKAVVARYSAMKPTAIFFSKLDETYRYGQVFSLAADTGLPLSYFSIGQDVPDDVQLAHTGKLTSMVIEGKLKRG